MKRILSILLLATLAIVATSCSKPMSLKGTNWQYSDSFTEQDEYGMDKITYTTTLRFDKTMCTIEINYKSSLYGSDHDIETVPYTYDNGVGTLDGETFTVNKNQLILGGTIYTKQ